MNIYEKPLYRSIIFIRTTFLNRNHYTFEHLLFYFLVCGFFFMPLGTSPFTLFAVLSVVIWIISGTWLRQWRTYLQESWAWPLLFFSILPWICLMYSSDPWGMGIGYAKKTHYWIYGLALAAVNFKTFKAEIFIKAFLMGLMVNAVWAIAQMMGILPIHYDPSGYTGYTGLRRGYSELSTYLVIGICISSFYYMKEKGKIRKVIYMYFIVIYFFHICIMGGRASYLAILMLSPLIIGNVFKGFSPVKISVVCIILLGMMLLSPIVRDRIMLSVNQVSYHLRANQEIAWGKEYNIHQDRFYMWRGAIEIIRDHPFFGAGTGAYARELKQRRSPTDPTIAHPHNDLLHMTVSYGLLGIIAFIWFFGEMIKSSWKNRGTPEGFFIFSTALAMMLIGLFNTQILDAGTAFLLSLTAGMQRIFFIPNSDDIDKSTG